MSLPSSDPSAPSAEAGPGPVGPVARFPNSRWGGEVGNLLFRHTVKILLSCGYTAFSVFVLKQGVKLAQGAIFGALSGVWVGASSETKHTVGRKNLRVRKIDSDEVSGLGRKVGFVVYQVLLNGVWLGINTAFSKLSSKTWSAVNGFLIAAPLMARASSTLAVAVRRRETADNYAAHNWVPDSVPFCSNIARLFAFSEEPVTYWWRDR